MIPLHWQVISVLLARGAMTADECAECLGANILSIRPCFSELKRQGRIAPTGERRQNISGRPARIFRAVRRSQGKGRL